MNDLEALKWKELYVEQLEDKDNGDILFPTFPNFVKDVKGAFRQADRTQDAMNKLMALKQGTRTAEELLTEFRLLAGQAGLEDKTPSDNIHLIGLFRNALNPQLARRILFGEQVPKTIVGWADKAIQFDTNYRMAMILTGRNPTRFGQRNGGERRNWFGKTNQKAQD